MIHEYGMGTTIRSHQVPGDDLTVSEALRQTRDEEVQAVHLSPEGRLSFRLPDDRPGLGLDIGGGVQEPELVLHTVMIRLEDRQVDLDGVRYVHMANVAGPSSVPARTS